MNDFVHDFFGGPRPGPLFEGFAHAAQRLPVGTQSLGTRSLNEMMKHWICSLGGAEAPVQVIWQTGKYYEREMREFLAVKP